MVSQKAIRRVTAARKERLNRIAEILYNFLPLTSMSKNAVIFMSIFSESSIQNYLDVKGNKQQALEQGFTKLYRYHERLPFIIIRKIIPAAKAYRRYKRNPLTRKELDELADCLAAIGIDMVEELKEVEMDEILPRITVPPEQLKEWFCNYDLQSAIALDPLQLFIDGHFNEAVRKAAEKFEDHVQELSGIGAYGRDLMARTFKDDNYLDVSNLEPENQQGFIEGYKFLAMGLMSAIRNTFSHGDEERRVPEECFEMLLFINWLFRFLKKSEKEDRNG